MFEIIESQDDYARNFKDYACMLEEWAYTKRQYDCKPLPANCYMKLEHIIMKNKRMKA